MDNSVNKKESPKKSASTTLSVKTRVDEDFAIIELAGALTLSPALSQLREAARKVLATGSIVGLILCVQDVTYTDSAGLGELTFIYSVTSKKACPLRMVGVTPSLRKMLEMTRLDELLQPAESIIAAKKQMKV